mmetsp:Transcript_17292/g.17238  ORF Transcript_17292/g.17238 Transcript_17292/m.17238 type:complete len:279 (-) Transcript_17292:928-1764(-)
MIVPVIGTTPGRRYGHTLLFSKPHLLLFAGNTGSETVNDVWCLNVERSPFSWQKIEIVGDQPNARVYHSAALCVTGSASGMMIIFGGRTGDQSALNDSWGLRRHRDGRWDWVRAPYKPGGILPTPRYQHTSTFLDSVMIVVGGRTNRVGESVALEVYDTDSSEWYRFPSILRFRHSCISLDTLLYIHGGFEHDTPNIPTSVITKVDTSKLFTGFDNLAPKNNQRSSPKPQESRPLPPPPDQDLSKTRPGIIPVITSSTSERGNPLHNIFINHLLRPTE